MSTRANGISTIRDAWKYAALEDTRPEEIPAEYTDNRALPNIASLLTACKVSLRDGAIYAERQLVKYEDLAIAAKTLSFSVLGQTNTVGVTVHVVPSMITSMTLNDASLSAEQIENAHQGNGLYKFTNFTSSRVHVIIEAQYQAQSITYRRHDEDKTFNVFNGSTVYLKDANNPPCSEAKYAWLNNTDIDLNFFVIKKNTDGTYKKVGMLGYLQNAANAKKYWPVDTNGNYAPGRNAFPESGFDFCLSFDVDDTGGGNHTEILTILPVDLTWQQIMQKYNFAYAAIDYSSINSMHGMTAALSSDFDPNFTDSIQLESTQSTINAWLICRFGADTGGNIVIYKTDGNESIVFSTNSTTVLADVSKVGLPLTIKTGCDWTTQTQ